MNIKKNIKFSPLALTHCPTVLHYCQYDGGSGREKSKYGPTWEWVTVPTWRKRTRHIFLSRSQHIHRVLGKKGDHQNGLCQYMSFCPTVSLTDWLITMAENGECNLSIFEGIRARTAQRTLILFVFSTVAVWLFPRPTLMCQVHLRTVGDSEQLRLNWPLDR